MRRIKFQTKIKAHGNIVFDLSLSINLHKISTAHTNEEAISGKTSVLIGMDQSVTWRAKHFGIYQSLTSKITKFKSPKYFADKMVKGVFTVFKHEHHFSELNKGTLAINYFDYKSPFGIFGKLANKLFLKKHRTELLTKRNRIVK